MKRQVRALGRVLTPFTPANLAPRDIDELAAIVATKLKRMQYRSGLLNGFLAQTGFIFEPP